MEHRTPSSGEGSRIYAFVDRATPKADEASAAPPPDLLRYLRAKVLGQLFNLLQFLDDVLGQSPFTDTGHIGRDRLRCPRQVIRFSL